MQAHLAIPSEIDRIPEVYAWLQTHIAPVTPPPLCHRILLIAQEIVTNAVVHGNGQDPDKRVTVALELNDAHILLRVTDEGGGIKALPSAEEAEDMGYLDEGGRGLKLAVKLCRAISLEGNQVVLTFARD